jgi:hypothetical protein
LLHALIHCRHVFSKWLKRQVAKMLARSLNSTATMNSLRQLSILHGSYQMLPRLAILAKQHLFLFRCLRALLSFSLLSKCSQGKELGGCGLFGDTKWNGRTWCMPKTRLCIYRGENTYSIHCIKLNISRGRAPARR